MGAEFFSGTMSAWLFKKKSGTAMIRVRQYNKRYFTLDFERQVFFYAHAEESTKVSNVMPFSDIISASVQGPLPDNSDNASVCSRASKVSILRRLSSTITKEVEQEHTVTVLLRPDRVMELGCSSAMEAIQWYEAFQAAVAIGHSPRTTSEDRGALNEAPSSGLKSQAAHPGPDEGALGSDAPVSATDSPGKEPAQLTQEVLDEPHSNHEAQAIEEPAPPARGTFLDLSMELQEGPASGSPEGFGASTSNPAETTAVVSAGTAVLKACDFGLEAEDDQDSEAGSSDSVDIPDLGATASSSTRQLHGGIRPDLDSAGSVSQAFPAGPPSAIYGDRHSGLSMKERLANLEFSDEEDDDEDPLGLKAKATS